MLVKFLNEDGNGGSSVAPLGRGDGRAGNNKIGGELTVATGKSESRQLCPTHPARSADSPQGDTAAWGTPLLCGLLPRPALGSSLRCSLSVTRWPRSGPRIDEGLFFSLAKSLFFLFKISHTAFPALCKWTITAGVLAGAKHALISSSFVFTVVPN